MSKIACYDNSLTCSFIRRRRKSNSLSSEICCWPFELCNTRRVDPLNDNLINLSHPLTRTRVPFPYHPVLTSSLFRTSLNSRLMRDTAMFAILPQTLPVVSFANETIKPNCSRFPRGQILSVFVLLLIPRRNFAERLWSGAAESALFKPSPNKSRAVLPFGFTVSTLCRGPEKSKQGRKKKESKSYFDFLCFLVSRGLTDTTVSRWRRWQQRKNSPRLWWSSKIFAIAAL